MVVPLLLLLFCLVVLACGVLHAVLDAAVAQRRCDAMERKLADGALDYRTRTAAIRRKGWDTRRKREAELEARQLEFKAVTEATEVRDDESTGPV